MDVYEHIALEDRASIHAAIKSLLSDESRLVITVPTPAILEHARIHDPAGLQPVDEDINIDDIKRLARETATDFLYYRKVGIWDYGDFAHLAFGRYQELAKVALREYRPDTGRKQRLREFLGLGQKQSNGRLDYLGSDVGRPVPRDMSQRFKVSAVERNRLACAWLQRSGQQPGS